MTETPLTAAERVKNVTGRTAFGGPVGAFLAVYADDCDVLVTMQEHDGEPRTLLSVQIAWEQIEANADLHSLDLTDDDLADTSGHDEVKQALTEALHDEVKQALRADNLARFLALDAESDFSYPTQDALTEYADGAAFDAETGGVLLDRKALADFYEDNRESFVPGLDGYARTATDLLEPAVERRTVQYLALNAV